MKRIENLHGGAMNMMTSGITLSKNGRNGEVLKRKTVCLASNVHAVADNVSFREEITLKKLLCNALDEYVRGDGYKCGKYDYSSTVRPTVLLPRELNSRVRLISHDFKIPERDIFCEALSRYIRKYYLTKYPDIPEINNI